MLGAIVGDIVGSRFEFHNLKSKRFDLFHPKCTATDDSVMTLAIASALMRMAEKGADLSAAAVQEMRRFGRRYASAGYGGMFVRWLASPDPRPYNSFGNGAAMRVSPVGWLAQNEDEVRSWSAAVTEVTHNHPEGLRGAEATAMSVFLLRNGCGKGELKRRIEEEYGYDLSFTLDSIRPSYAFDVTCQGSVPPAVVAFLEATGFEDALRNAVSIGGDSDTLAAITGALAHAHYGIPGPITQSAMSYLDANLQSVLRRFRKLLQTTWTSESPSDRV